MSSANDTCHLEKPCSGISTYWEHTTMVIHSHDNDDMLLAPYSRTVDDAAWIYTLIDDNETSTEIWWGGIGDNGDTMGVSISYRFML